MKHTEGDVVGTFFLRGECVETIEFVSQEKNCAIIQGWWLLSSHPPQHLPFTAGNKSPPARVIRRALVVSIFCFVEDWRQGRASLLSVNHSAMPLSYCTLTSTATTA
jgi:hypothetical protein